MILALAGAGALAQPPGDARLDEPIPLAAGTVWVFRETYAERLGGGLDALEEAETRFEVRGGTRPFLLQTGGFDPASGPIARGQGWLRLAPWTGEDALPLPLEPGRSGPASPGAAPWRVEEWEEIEVPAGRFRALRVALRSTTTHSVLWIAPGVGVVRETQGPPGRRPEIERVLLRWSAPPG